MRLLSLTVLLSLLLVAPAAAAPTPNTTYGGGAFASEGYPRIGDTAALSIAVRPDGRTARIVGTLGARCSSRYDASHRFAASRQMGADGRLRLALPTAKYEYAAGGSRPRGRATLDLDFNGPVATGTLRFTAEFRSGRDRIRCDRTLPLQLRVVAEDPGSPGAAEAGAAFFGTGNVLYRGAAVPVYFRVSRTARTLDRASVGAAVPCSPGDQVDFLQNYSPNVRIAPDGTFRSSERFSVRYRGGGRTITRFRIEGRFTAQGVVGTYRVSSVTPETRRLRRTRCSSGTVAFGAIK